jgi:mRNA-degrading endonuclease RelE of RelBE toxin-antitoxin system
MLDILYSNQASRFLKNIDHELISRILAKIELPKENPIPHDSKKVQNTNLFRIRIGKYRVLYEGIIKKG